MAKRDKTTGRRITHLVFDFDGTLADSLPMTIAIYRQLTGDKDEWSDADVEAMRKMTLLQLARKLGVSLWRAPFLVRRGRKIMHARMQEITSFSGMTESIQSLHERGYAMHIVTSNSTENVNEFLRQHNLKEYFDEIHGGVWLLSKARVLKKMRRKFKHAQDVYYIGDEARDVAASKKARTKIVSVTWGYNHKDLLKQLQPDYLVDEPTDLLKTFA